MIPGSANPLLLASAAAAAGGYQVSRSLRFSSSDSAYLSRTPAVAGNRKTWTWAGWVKRSQLGTFQNLFGTADAGFANGTYFLLIDDNTLSVEEYGASSFTWRVRSTQVFRDASAWGHLLVACDTTQATASNRVRIYWNGTEITSFSTANYPTQNLDTSLNTASLHGIGRAGLYNSHYFNGYLADIHFIDGQALTPSSFTEVSATTGQLIPKTYSGTYGTNGFQLKFADNSSNTAATLGKDTSGNSNNWTPNNLSVDTLGSSNYYNFLTASTGFQASPYDKFKAFDGSTATEAAANGAGSVTFAPYLGIAYSSSVEVWTAASCSYNFNSGASTGSTNNNSYTTIVSGSGSLTSLVLTRGGGAMLNALRIDGNILIATPPQDDDSLVDTPTSYGTDTGVGGEVRGNYCTWNPLYANGTLSNGNLDVSTTTTNATTGTIFATSGKWYWETTVTTSNFNRIGVVNLAGAGQNLGGTANSWAILHDGQVYTNSVTAAYGPSYGVNDVISIALDIDAGKIWYGKNGTWLVSGNPSTGANPSQTFTAGQTMAPAVASGSGTCAYVLNAGARSFAYTNDRTGFKALCDTNLGDPLVAKPNTLMDVALYTGNGSTQTISGLNFSPDLVWIKSRSAAYAQLLYDTVRGAGLLLRSDDSTAESGNSGDLLASFNSNGFAVNSTYLGSPNPAANDNSQTYVAWAWDAGTSTVSNTAGSITSQVRANPTAGFSVATFTGAATGTVGHGLGVAPSMIIMKARTSNPGANDWFVYHKSVGNTAALLLNSTAATNTYTYWNNTSPTSTVFSIGSGIGTPDWVAYCFAPVVGYSAMGSYVASPDLPFVYLGFRPRFILIKATIASTNWAIFDSSTGPYNLVNTGLKPNSSAAEYTDTTPRGIDFLSNGFKVRGDWNSGDTNFASTTYIYAAFAESPFQYARAR